MATDIEYCKCLKQRNADWRKAHPNWRKNSRHDFKNPKGCKKSTKKALNWKYGGVMTVGGAFTAMPPPSAEYMEKARRLLGGGMDG